MTTVQQITCPDRSSPCPRPLFLARVSAGFPSPADDYLEDHLDLNHYLIKHPAATFFVRATGDSMLDAGIHPGDVLVVDRSLDPGNNSVVIAVINGEMTVKRVMKSGGKLFLVPANPRYRPMEIKEGMDFEVWGVVTSVIHKV
jgi:DNA polymerase V